MGVWAHGNFDNDTALDWLDDITGQLLDEIAEVMESPELLEADEPLAFVVSEMALTFLKPARIDDALVVRTLYEAVKGPRLLIRQSVERGGEVLCRAEVTAVCIHLDGRPRRPTRALVDKVSPWLAPAG